MKWWVVVAMVVTALVTYTVWSRAYRRAYIDKFVFNEGLRRKFREVRPGLTRVQEDLVFDALREWFHVCRLAGQHFVSMPSQVVDDAWHTFILFTRSYGEFCRRGLGRFLHHTPAEAMSAPTQAQDGIRRAWRLACICEQIDPRAPGRLPLLFAIDATLGIANGFHYALQCEPGVAGAYCASHIGCGSGCGSGCSGGSSCGGDGGGGGCGGD